MAMMILMVGNVAHNEDAYEDDDGAGDDDNNDENNDNGDCLKWKH